MTYNNSEIALYIHIPFCDQICHYCDFAKTANWSSSIADDYFERVQSHLKFWKNRLLLENKKISSVFFGGGTPGIFTDKYETVLQEIRELFTKNCEITLEANPSNINEVALKTWKEIGVNRLSIGVQSFREKELKFLVRDHSPEISIGAIELSKKYFQNLNVDLIYGIPGQSLADFEEDLSRAISLGVNHLSLYNLTFENGTPIGRAYHRGKISEDNIAPENQFYKLARAMLADKGYDHEEVSNWSKPGYSCNHNWVYWQMKPYVAVGAGAHGFIRGAADDLGIRYSFKKNDRVFEQAGVVSSLEKYFEQSSAIVEERNADDLLIEYVTTSLRTSKGVPIKEIEDNLGVVFNPNQKLQDQIEKGMVELGDSLIFDPEYWFFENIWGLEVLESFSNKT